MKTATVSDVRGILGNGLFGTITFEKVDGSIRVLNGRLGVRKGVNGSGHNIPTVVKVYDVQKENGLVKGWRTVKPEMVMQIVANKQVYNFAKGKKQPEFINDVKRVGHITVVKMNGKDVYYFFGISRDLFKEFAIADSRGKFFNDNIKGKFHFTKVV